MCTHSIAVCTLFYYNVYATHIKLEPVWGHSLQPKVNKNGLGMTNVHRNEVCKIIEMKFAELKEGNLRSNRYQFCKVIRIKFTKFVKL